MRGTSNMLKNALQFFRKYWLFFLIAAQPLLDILAFWQQNSIGTAAGVLRLAVMVVLPVHILITSKHKKKFLIAMGVIALFSVLHILNGFRVGYISLFQDVAYLLRVIQMPVLAICFIHYIRDEKTRDIVNYGFLASGTIIVVTTAIAHLTGTGVYTYVHYNVGWTGWISNANSQSIIIISLAPIVLYYAVKSRRKLLTIAVPIVVFATLILNGTKACYYSSFLIFGGFAVFLLLEYLIKRKDGKKLPVIALCLFTVLLILTKVVYPYTPRAQVDDSYESSVTTTQEEVDKDLEKIHPNKKPSDSSGTQEPEPLTPEEIMADPVLKQQVIEIYKDKLDKGLVERFGIEKVLEEYGVTPAAYELSDMRMKKLIYAHLLWEESDFLTKLVGFEYTQIDTGESYDLENDWPAIYYYYGYIGLALYILFIAYFAFLIIKRLIKDWKGSLNLYNFALLITLGLQLGLAQYSGAILRRPNVSIYLSLILALIYYQTVRAPLSKKRKKDSSPDSVDADIPELPEEH